MLEVKVEQKVESHEGRWGWHPCDYQTFRKLKLLHKYYWITVRQFSNWKRWDRKEPQNRLIRKWTTEEVRLVDGTTASRPLKKVVGEIPEPKYCPFFVYSKYGRLMLTDHKIIENYRNARYPVPQDMVKPLTLSIQEIDKMLAEVSKYFE
jgi:hypothetical protein